MSALVCPKHMVHGPCGGVQPDGTCEVVDERCPYVDQPVHAFDPTGLSLAQRRSTTQLGDELRAQLTAGRVVVADFPAVALDATSIRTTADLLRGSVHAVLAGDSPRNRVQFPPSYRARLIQDAGLLAWAGVNCRDRNRVAIEGELAALADLGAAAVHCVTGDHPGLGARSDAAAVFDLDSTQVAALARDAGLLVSVGESPSSPPVGLRSARLLEKLRAGAEVCFVNHCGGTEAVREFIGAVHALGGRSWFIPCVPIVVDRASAELLATFTNFVLPAGYLQRILAAADPEAEGIDAAVELSEELMQLPGVAGVNLSGGGGPGQEVPFARALAEIGSRLGVARASAQPGR